MPRVDVVASVPGCDPDELFDHVARFEAYADIAPNVLEVHVRPGDGGTVISNWRVRFRSGTLKWEEEDRVDRENRWVGFEQTSGDLDLFVGEWKVGESSDGPRIAFGAEFDLGIPSLASMLDPVAVRTLRNNVHELIESFARAAGAGEVRYEDDEAEVPR